MSNKKSEKKDLYEPRFRATRRQIKKPAERPSWHPEMVDPVESSTAYYDEPELNQEEARLIRRINDAT